MEGVSAPQHMLHNDHLLRSILHLRDLPRAVPRVHVQRLRALTIALRRRGTTGALCWTRLMSLHLAQEHSVALSCEVHSHRHQYYAARNALLYAAPGRSLHSIVSIDIASPLEPHQLPLALLLPRALLFVTVDRHSHRIVTSTSTSGLSTNNWDPFNVKSVPGLLESDMTLILT